MGVKDLMSILRKKVPHLLRSSAQKPVIRAWVDTPLIVVASCKKAESEGYDPFCLVEQSLKKTLNHILALECKEVKWIFDGKGREEKKRTILGRAKNHESYSKKCEIKQWERVQTLGNLELAESVYESYLPKRVTIRDVSLYARRVLALFPFSEMIVAKHDSEEHIARMMQDGDAAITNDSDALVFGCSTIVQNFGTSFEVWIERDEILEGLGMTLHELRVLSVFLGNDFNARRANKGPVAALKAIKEKKSIEEYGENDQAWIDEAKKSYRVFSGIE